MVVPNLHSNPRTKPGDVRSFDLQAILMGVCSRFGAEQAAVLGKSWGGANVASFAASNPSAIARLVLDAPAVRRADVRSLCSGFPKVPILMLWAEDDGVIPFGTSAEWLSACPKARLHSEPTGGHRILAAFAQPVVAFAAMKPSALVEKEL